MKITGHGLLKATSVVFVVSAIAGASAWGLKNDLKPVQSTYGSTPVIEEVVETPIEAPAPVEQVTVVEETPSPKPEPKPEPVPVPVDKKTTVMAQVAATAVMLKVNPEVQKFCIDKKIVEAGGYDSVNGQKWIELGTTGLINPEEGQRNFAHWSGMACSPIYFMTRPI